MAQRKKSKPKQQRKLPDWAKAIHALFATLGCATQEEFAAHVGSKQGTVSTWLRGDETRKPSADTFIRMAGRAPNSDLASLFLRLADISDEVIFSVARKLKTERIQEATALVEKGSVVPIRRYRETIQGREQAGPAIPLPTEFILNPDSTICLVLDEKATSTVNSPKAIFILDETEKDTTDLMPLWGQVVFVEFNPKLATDLEWDAGIYAGRLLDSFLWPRRGEFGRPMAYATLLPLNELKQEPRFFIGRWRDETLPLLDSAIAGESKTEDGKDPIVIAARNDFQMRARRELRLDSGWRILGRVLGRLKLQESEFWGEA